MKWLIVDCPIICWYQGYWMHCQFNHSIKYGSLICFRSKSFKDGGESFVLVAVVTDVAQEVTEGEEGGVRHM